MLSGGVGACAGMILGAVAPLAREPNPQRDEVREASAAAKAGAPMGPDLRRWVATCVYVVHPANLLAPHDCRELGRAYR